MFEKNMSLALLLDIYGNTLDEHTRSILKAYYEDDLSLSEIADGEEISRQGVRHIIKKGEEQLRFLEEALHLSKVSEALEAASGALLSIKKRLEEKTRGDLEKEIKDIETTIKLITDKGL